MDRGVSGKKTFEKCISRHSTLPLGDNLLAT